MVQHCGARVEKLLDPKLRKISFLLNAGEERAKGSM